MNRAHAILRAAVTTGLCAAALAGCRAGGNTSAESANDALRRRVMDLESQVGKLEGKNRELAVKLEESEHTRTSALPKDVLEAIPRCVSVTISGLSGFQPARGPDRPAMVIVDIEPVDGFGRFVQIVGTVEVEARPLSPVGSDHGPSPALTATLSPANLRDAYRSGLMGSHYTIEIPAPGITGPGDLVMRVRFNDALTGKSHQAELTRRIQPLPQTTAVGK